MNSSVRAVVFWLVIVFSAFLLWQVVRAGGGATKTPEISYSAFLTDVESNNVAAITLSGNHVEGRYANGSVFRVSVPSSQEGMLQLLRQHKVEIFVREASTDGQSYFMNLVPIILLGALWFFMIRQLKRTPAQSSQTVKPIEPR